jgi:aryl carrier-like protein
MVPSVLIWLDALPLTPNGKVDRRALPAPTGARPYLANEYVPPRNPVEKALAESWGEVLGLEKVGIDDNFFIIGGDSMRIVQAISRAQRLRVTFSVYQLYQCQTIRELAQVAVVSEPSMSEEPPPHQENEDEAELALLLAELDSLSEEEVRTRLRERMPGPDLDKVSA